MSGMRTRRAARSMCGLVAASVIALTAGTALADDPPRPWLAQPPAAAPAPIAAAEAAPVPWRASLLIGVSAALGAAAMWVRSRKGGLAKLTSSRELRVISSVRVGAKGHLVLAGIGDRAILLGVTDHSVRRIAWLPAESLAAPGADLTGALAALSAGGAQGTTILRADGNASTAIVAAGKVGGSLLESGAAPSRGKGPSTSGPSKGGFAEILRKIGGRPVDAPPAGAKDPSPAATLAELRRDSVQWSKSAAASVATPSPAAVVLASTAQASHGDLEQQAAGILKRRSRRRA